MARKSDPITETPINIRSLTNPLAIASVLLLAGAWMALATTATPQVDPPGIELTPTRVSVVGPRDQAVDVSTAPTLSVTHVGESDATVQFYVRQVNAPAGPDFTLIGLPDTQYYVSSLAGGNPAIFHRQTQWIAEQRDTRNIAFVAQLGDCVEHGDSQYIEWLHAHKAMRRLEVATSELQPYGIPFGVAVGNHDQSPIGVPSGESTVSYNRIFGSHRFAGRDYYGGHYGINNDNHYELFSASGLNFIAIFLEYDPNADPDVLTWADGLLKQYPNRRGIVVSHHLINADSLASYSYLGWMAYRDLRSNPNFFLMLSGHSPGEGRRSEYWGGRTVHMLEADYQSRPRGGDGWLRIMEFSPSQNVIRVRTYSPWRDEYEADADSSSQFTLAYDMSASDFSEVASVDGVNGGEVTATVVKDLEGNAEYEWYATVTDAFGTSAGPVSRFRTMPAYPLVVDALGDGQVVRTPSRRRYDRGSDVVLTAKPADGMRFVRWAGDADGFGNPMTLRLDREMHVRAIFEPGTTTVVTAIGPATLSLEAPRPTPTTGRASIRFSLPTTAHVTMRVWDVQGRAISTIVNTEMSPGEHEAVWNGRVNGDGAPAEPGTYFCTLEVGDQRLTRRIIVAR